MICPKCSRQMSHYNQLKYWECHYCDDYRLHYSEVKQQKEIQNLRHELEILKRGMQEQFDR